MSKKLILNGALAPDSVGAPSTGNLAINLEDIASATTITTSNGVSFKLNDKITVGNENTPIYIKDGLPVAVTGSSSDDSAKTLVLNFGSVAGTSLQMLTTELTYLALRSGALEGKSKLEILLPKDGDYVIFVIKNDYYTGGFGYICNSCDTYYKGAVVSEGTSIGVQAFSINKGTSSVSFREISPQEQSDWNITDTSSKAFIKNKPTIPTAQSIITALDGKYVPMSGTTESNPISGTVHFNQSSSHSGTDTSIELDSNGLSIDYGANNAAIGDQYETITYVRPGTIGINRSGNKTGGLQIDYNSLKMTRASEGYSVTLEPHQLTTEVTGSGSFKVNGGTNTQVLDGTLQPITLATINNQSLMNGGNITISSGGGDTINNYYNGFYIGTNGTTNDIYVNTQDANIKLSAGTGVTISQDKNSKTITFKADIGSGQNQVAAGNHSHSGYLTSTSQFYTHLYAGSGTSNTNTAATNGNVYLKLYDDNIARERINIVGSGNTTVQTSSNDGKIIIYSSGGSTTDNDTKNTAGATNSSDKLYLIGAQTQDTNPQTYSSRYLYVQNSQLTLEVPRTNSQIPQQKAVVTPSYLSLSGPTEELGLTLVDSQDGNSTLLSSRHIQCKSGNIVVFDVDTIEGNVLAKAFYESSDKSLKENINSVSDTNKVEALEFKEFNFKSDEKKTKKYGVIAQEVEEAGLGNLVLTNENGVKSVDYISLLCLKMEQMKREMDEMKQEIKKLKGE